jgi:hypothetical protein
MFGCRLAGASPMSKAGVVSWIATAVALGMSVSAAVGQGGTASPQAMANTASTPLAAMVPPVRRVRPKTPPGRLAVPNAKGAAAHKTSATVRRGAPVAAPACAQGSAFNRKFRRCERKNSAKTGGASSGAHRPMPRPRPGRASAGAIRPICAMLDSRAAPPGCARAGSAPRSNRPRRAGERRHGTRAHGYTLSTSLPWLPPV